VPLKTSDFDRRMQQLEGEIKRLEAEYNMFFAGRLPRLPCETRDGGAHKTGEPAIPVSPLRGSRARTGRQARWR
jgi:hypothetical protein